MKLEIDGLEVDFPFEPYECQTKYMRSVVSALRSGQNALLESPTGTGKTLCLLCAALAWREAFVKGVGCAGDGAKREPGEQLTALSGTFSPPARGEGGGVGDGSGGARKKSGPRIIYASRTHSQLSQVVRELRRTTYRPKTSVLGSRAQMCVNSAVTKLATASQQNTMCYSLVKRRSCRYKAELDGSRERLLAEMHARGRRHAAADLEDIVKFGSARGACPFYLAREAHEDSDIVFIPYNYLISPKVRETLGGDWANDVVIIDEAHNVDVVCMDAMSFDLTSWQREAYLQELKRSNNVGVPDGVDQQIDTNYDALIAMLNELEDTVKALPLNGDDYFSASGAHLVDVLARVGIRREDGKLWTEKLRNARTAAEQMSISGRGGLGAASLGILEEVFETVLAAEHEHLRVHYRVCVTREAESHSSGSIRGHFASTDARARGGRTLSLWCMNPGTAVRGIFAKSVRSMLLTSGTLTPLAGIERELSVPFPVKLENEHVIGAQQLFVGVLRRGASGSALNSSFRNRQSEHYVDDLGRALLHVVSEGVLVFFPSYAMLSNAVTSWKRRGGLYDAMNALKPILTEPRDAASFADMMQQHGRNVESVGGGLLLAVCRGKTSEGLDFADHLARAVVLTGIPYPMFRDPRVILKREYTDQTRRGGGAEWYSQAAFRAVNQAIGRVIRHRDDYGAVLLFDERFAEGGARMRLPAWMRNSVRAYDTVDSAVASLSEFFARCRDAPFVQRRKRALESAAAEQQQQQRDALAEEEEASPPEGRWPSSTPPPAMRRRLGEKADAAVGGLPAAKVRVARTMATMGRPRAKTEREDIQRLLPARYSDERRGERAASRAALADVLERSTGATTTTTTPPSSAAVPFENFLPAVKQRLSRADYLRFSKLLTALDALTTPSAGRSAPAGGGDAGGAAAAVPPLNSRSLFQELHSLLSRADGGAEVLQELSAFVPPAFRAEYRRYVLGFLLRSSRKNGRQTDLFDATRKSIGNQAYEDARKLLAGLMKLHQAGDASSSEAMIVRTFADWRSTFERHVPEGWSPSCAELLAAWRECIPVQWRRLYDRVVLNAPTPQGVDTAAL